MVKFLTSKQAFFWSYLATALSCGLALLAFQTDWEIGIIIAIIGAKIGISNAFNYIYFCAIEFFPSAFLGLVIGGVNVAGRCATIAAPMVAETEHPFPMLSCIILCTLSIAATLMLVKPKSKELKIDDTSDSEEPPKCCIEIYNFTI